MSKHRDGVKIRGTHTTYIDLALVCIDILQPFDEVSGVSPGVIQNGTGVSGGMRKVKIGDMRGGVFLTVRQSRSVQELRVYTTNVQSTKLELARALRNRGIPISFKH